MDPRKSTLALPGETRHTLFDSFVPSSADAIFRSPTDLCECFMTRPITLRLGEGGRGFAQDKRILSWNKLRTLEVTAKSILSGHRSSVRFSTSNLTLVDTCLLSCNAGDIRQCMTVAIVRLATLSCVLFIYTAMPDGFLIWPLDGGRWSVVLESRIWSCQGRDKFVCRRCLTSVSTLCWWGPIVQHSPAVYRWPQDDLLKNVRLFGTSFFVNGDFFWSISRSTKVSMKCNLSLCKCHKIQRTLLWFLQLKFRGLGRSSGKYLPEDRPRPWNF